MIKDWTIQTTRGERVDKRDVLSVTRAPLDRAARIDVQTDDPKVPRVQARVDPTRGERLFLFTRNVMHVSSGAPRAPLAVPVAEVQCGCEHKCKLRLYLHPLLGPILSSEDIYF